MKSALRFVPIIALGAAACSTTGAAPPANESGQRDIVPSAAAEAAPSARAGSTTAAASKVLAGPPQRPLGSPALGLVAVRGDGSLVRVFGADRGDELPRQHQRLSLDESTLVRTMPFGRATRVVWRDVFSGEQVGRLDVDVPDLEPAATDVDGGLVALVDPPTAAAGDETIAGGKRDTTIVLVDRDRGEVARFRLQGNLVPELFVRGSAKGVPTAVAVLEYLPAAAPTHYRVRLLDTSTGELGMPVSLRDKALEIDAKMAGVSRTQVFAPHAGGLLFTLYRGVAGEDGRHGYAFVHTLGQMFGGVWCLDIAPELELDEREGALVVAGDRLVVASANGSIGSYDIDSVVSPDGDPSMQAVGQLRIPRWDEAPVMAAAGDRVWVAWGEFVYQLDARTLESDWPYVSDRPVTAMTATADGVLLAHPDGSITTPSGAQIDLPHRPAGASNQIVALLVR